MNKNIVTIEQQENGFALSNKGKPLLTPAKNEVVLPTRALAEAIAFPLPPGEGQGEGSVAQAYHVSPHPSLLPKGEGIPGAGQRLRLACIAIDMLADPEQRADITRQLLEYAETDLVSYRADVLALRVQQEEAFAPLLAWAHERFGVTFAITDGVMPVRQPAANRNALEAALSGYDAWKLATLFAVVKPLGSLVLALALTEQQITAQTAFYYAHLEEAYETQKWGMDREKEARLEGVKNEVYQAAAFLALLHEDSCQEQSDFN